MRLVTLVLAASVMVAGLAGCERAQPAEDANGAAAMSTGAAPADPHGTNTQTQTNTNTNTQQQQQGG